MYVLRVQDVNKYAWRKLLICSWMENYIKEKVESTMYKHIVGDDNGDR